ncbi:hypothetical protein D1007_55504 [Hordeum vulgare]|nr:hypothetical protein D1007_55504 [Hordeum vulgare]
MTVSGNALLASLSSEMKHEMVALAAASQYRRTRQIERGMWSSLPVVSDDDPTIETGWDNGTTPYPAPMHVGMTTKEAQAHYDTTMAEV